MAWSAKIIVTEGAKKGGPAKIIADHFAVEVIVEATSMPEAKTGAEKCLHLMAEGRMTSIRFKPEADEFKVDSKTTLYKAYCRFTVVDAPGEWADSEYSIRKIPSACA